MFELNKHQEVLAEEYKILSGNITQERIRLHNEHYRLSEEGGVVSGVTVPIFYVENNHITLTQCCIYRDKKVSIGYGTDLICLDTLRKMIDSNQVRTSVDDNVWVTLPGLGRFQITEGYWMVEKEELWKEVINRINVLNGEMDVVEKCLQAFLAYNNEPGDTNRELLLRAYEAVPEHYQRFVQGDMDAKDSNIRRILYGNEW